MSEAIVRTFLDEEQVEARVTSTAPSTTGLIKLEHEGRMFVRHIDRVSPVNEAARALLKKQ